jgi:hypothetical protein
MKPQKKTQRRTGRVLLLVIASLLGLCLLSAAGLYFVNQGLPTRSAQVETLPSEAVIQLEEALHLQSALGNSVWPGFGSAHVPLISWNEQYSFLCVYGIQPPAGWEAVKLEVAGQPCFRQPSTDPQNFAVPVGEEWAGSMSTREYMLIEIPRQLGEMIAGPLAKVFPYFILTRPLSATERYIGMVTHESFHAFQAQAARARFDDAEDAYASSDAYWQDYDPLMHDAWKAEVDALYKAVTSTSDEQSREYARQFLQLRQERRTQYLPDEELVRYEQRYEWLEGMAKYAELEIQRQAHETPNYEQTGAILYDVNFQSYGNAESLWKSELKQMRTQATRVGDTRMYYTGFAQAVLLDRFQPGWKARMFDQGVWVEDLLAQAVE